MRIHCPYCGTRGVEEFTYLGDATVRRPDPDAPEAAWVDYVYCVTTPLGRTRNTGITPRAVMAGWWSCVTRARTKSSVSGQLQGVQRHE